MNHRVFQCLRIAALALSTTPVAVAQRGELPGIPDCAVDCGVVPQAGLAFLNQAIPLKHAAYDLIPVYSTGEGFYVVYSHRGDGPPGEFGAANNVGMFLFPLVQNASNGRDRVLVFGTGYGDWPGFATYGSACDATFIDHVIQTEFLFDPTNTTLQFVAPHGHYDHINPQVPRRLSNLGYKIGKIRHHDADADLISISGGQVCGVGATCPTSTVPYNNSGLPKISEMDWAGDGSPCEVDLSAKVLALDTAAIESLTFPSTLGTIRFAHNPGHTCGSVDLWIDANPTHIKVLGSNVDCGTYPWWVGDNTPLYDGLIKAHGNIVIDNEF